MGRELLVYGKFKATLLAIEQSFLDSGCELSPLGELRLFFTQGRRLPRYTVLIISRRAFDTLERIF